MKRWITTTVIQSRNNNNYQHDAYRFWCRKIKQNIIVLTIASCWTIVVGFTTVFQSFIVPRFDYTTIPSQSIHPNTFHILSRHRRRLNDLFATTSSVSDTTTATSQSSFSSNTKSTSTTTGSSTSTNTATVGGNIGDFEEVDGNFLLRPPAGQQPRALIHFLGGALVGASPHISYRYLLERLARSGYLVVATPYQLSFDHLSTCDEVIGRFEKIALPLARAYGALPVVGIGHSCGALLHLLITSLFPDTPRAANALISFNNKPVSEAVPFFDEFFAPFFTYVAARNATDHRPSGSEIIVTGLELAKFAAQGEIPSDELLTQALKLLIPPGIQSGPLAAAVSTSSLPPIVVPGAIRNAYSTITAPYTIAMTEAGVAPVVRKVLEALEQIPMLIDEVADGARDFTPPPALVKMAARRSYRARRTLIIQYNDDPIDESEEIEELLKAASQVIRMKRPMMAGSTIDVQRRTLPGSHAAPLLAPPLEMAEQFESLLGQDVAKERFLYTQADQTVEELVRWLEESDL
jgi:acetyl esterase/lipase